MRELANKLIAVAVLIACLLLLPARSWAEVKAWEGTITIPTYPWQEDVNPKFWALEGGPGLSTTVKGAITYPYAMQDDLSRTKVDRTYKALFLENEYLKVTCMPELGGRLHSVLDKTTGEQMFHLNRVIKPGMIAMRGAWISGGVEWNSGPHGHTVTCVSPVDAIFGHNKDGSAFLVISNQEKIFRTRWTVRLTLHPDKAYLDERIGIENPTDGMHPYYFWNCTAFPNLPGTRFIYPMTVGMDHSGEKFFSWPIHEGKDLSWLKNHDTWASVFAYQCEFDFFGAYDVDLDRGIVQVADHHELPGKKAWTWGNWEFGRVSQENLTDEDGPYIEVQSGPLPTQSDYGMLAPRQRIAWQEWWYPVHGLGDGFEYATKDVAVQVARVDIASVDDNLELRLLATGKFPQATCSCVVGSDSPLLYQIDLSPRTPQVVTVPAVGHRPVEVTVKARDGRVLASFVTPLPIPKVSPPDPSKFEAKPDDQLTVEEKYLKGRKFDRATDRLKARRYYEMALADDPGHVDSLRALAVLDLEAGLYQQAISRLDQALDRDSDDGLSWYFRGVCHLRLNRQEEALDCGYQAVKHPESNSLGYDLVGRALMRLGRHPEAVGAFREAVRADGRHTRAREHLALAHYANGDWEKAAAMAKALVRQDPLALPARALLALESKEAMGRFVSEAWTQLGEYSFETRETSLVFAELGLWEEAARLLGATSRVTYKHAPPHHSYSDQLGLYYLAYYLSQQGEEDRARRYLPLARSIRRDDVFPSRPEAIPVLQYAVTKDPEDACAHLHLGNLLASLGRVDEAVPHWEQAARLDPKLSIAWRNLGLVAATQDKPLAKAAEYYRQAIAARPSDQTLYRDLAEILIADRKRPEAIELLEKLPVEGTRRADVTIMLAQAYLAEQRFGDTLDLLESTPYFVHWEGQDVTWVMFNKAHVARGRKRLESGQIEAALEDFEAALTYPKNLGVGRSNRPPEAAAQYWRGKALSALGRMEEARAAWKEGAAGAEGSEEQNEHRKLCKEALERASRE